jgi:hypothetical protein
VAVFAGVVGELVAVERSALPALVERMAQDIPAVGDRIQTLEEIHGGSFRRSRWRDRTGPAGRARGVLYESEDSRKARKAACFAR